jgi:hypothetical protein
VKAISLSEIYHDRHRLADERLAGLYEADGLIEPRLATRAAALSLTSSGTFIGSTASDSDV